MTNNELITELLKYDGWVFKKEGKLINIDKYINGKLFKCSHAWVDDELSLNQTFYAYLTDMNILHMLAVKVFGDVVDSDLDVSYINDICFNIRNAIMCSPNEQGEHIQLATALVNAIRYISSNKAG